MPSDISKKRRLPFFIIVSKDQRVELRHPKESTTGQLSGRGDSSEIKNYKESTNVPVLIL